MTMTTADAHWFALHNEYLASDDWRLRRDAVMLRDRHECQAKLRPCTNIAQQVHHLTYRHWRNEPLFDLIAVCTPCHEEITRMERENRTMAPDGRLNSTERQARQKTSRRRLE